MAISDVAMGMTPISEGRQAPRPVRQVMRERRIVALPDPDKEALARS